MSNINDTAYPENLEFPENLLYNYKGSLMTPTKRKKIFGGLFRIPFIPLLFALFASCEKFDAYEDPQGVTLSAPAWIDSVKAEEMQEELINTMNKHELLGLQVCVAHREKGSWSLSLGTTAPEQKDPVEDQHVFRIGSVTKAYTAALIFRLIEEGYLELDQAVTEFYPEMANVKHVLVRHLLEHSSGIRDIFTMPSILINASNFPDKQWDPNHLAETCMKKRLLFQPGSEYSYSNTNYILLGLIAEQVTNRQLTELYTGYLFDRLGLSNTRFLPYQPPPDELITGYVHHYAVSFREWFPNEPENRSWSTLAFSSGAMVTNATELAAFMGSLFGGEFLSAESLDAMTGMRDGREKGLQRISVNGNTWYGHEGEITGFESIALFHPGSGRIIVVCSNTTPFRVKEAIEVIDATL